MHSRNGFSERDQRELLRIRRLLHRTAEPAFNEHRTGQIVEETLRGLGLEVSRAAGTGVVGLLRGGTAEGPTVAIRADMDALPVAEQTGVEWASETPGVMHACGHDAHMAMVLGAAMVLAPMACQLRGNVKFIFQPAEENVQGAKAMIDDGVMENPHVDALIGLHTGCLWRGIGPGEIGVRFGPLMASVDRFMVTFKGKGGHGATPHLAVDPVVMSAAAVLEMQTILSRELSPLDSAVLTVGRIEGGASFNIIPESCRIEGTVRTLNPAVRAFIEERLRAVVSRVAEGMRGEAEVEYESGPPPLINDADFTRAFQRFAARVAGAEKVKEIGEPTMGGEDVAYFLEMVPGTFFVHGSCAPEKGQIYPHHNPRFDVDEETFPLGSALFAGFALTWQQEAGTGTSLI